MQKQKRAFVILIFFFFKFLIFFFTLNEMRPVFSYFTNEAAMDVNVGHFADPIPGLAHVIY